MFSRFDIKPQCDSQTDRQTHSMCISWHRQISIFCSGAEEIQIHYAIME